MPFPTLLGATIGKDMELSELKVFYDCWPAKISPEGYPEFKIVNDQREEILRITCQRLLENLYDSYFKLNNGKHMSFILKKRLEDFVRKNVVTLISPTSEKNNVYFVRMGRLFFSIDPNCSNMYEFEF